MLYCPNRQDLAGICEARVDRARMVTKDLLIDILAYCRGVGRPDGQALAPRLYAFVESGAWTDAAFAVIAAELPHWSPTRLAFDDGEWVCTLALHPQMPAWLDDAVDGRHASLPLAVLAAAVAARTVDLKPRDACSGRGSTAPSSDEALCCDNFT
jgi:hypothetical protein